MPPLQENMEKMMKSTLELLKGVPTREEFAKIVGIFTAQFGKLETKLDEKIQKMLNAEFLRSLQAIKDEYSSTIARLRGDAQSSVDNYLKSLDAKKWFDDFAIKYQKRLAEIPDTSDLAQQAADLVPLQEIKDETPEETRDKLEKLRGEARLDVSAIKGLEEYVKKNSGSGDIRFVPATGAGGGRTVKSYDLSDQLNGVLKTFSMPAFYRIISVHLSSFPNIMRPTTDYTSDASAMTITFTDEITVSSSLNTGQTLIVVYSE